MSRELQRHTRSIAQRALLSITRGWLTRVNDKTKMQTVQVGVFEGQTTERERIQQYGFSSVPIADDGVDTVQVGLGGAQNHTIILAIEDRRLRPRDQPEGSVSLYTQEDDPEAQPEDAKARLQLVDDTLILRFDGKIDAKSQDSHVLLTPEEIVLEIGSSRIRLTGSLITIDSPTVRIQGKPDFKIHSHEDSGGTGVGGPVFPSG